MKILVTGAGGYVGSTLCMLLLKHGCKVRAVDNFYKGHCDALIPYCRHPDFEFMFGDVTNKEDVGKMLKGIDAVVHLAGLVGFPACAKYPTLSRLINVQGSRLLVETKSKNVPFIFASTGSVYGKIEEKCTENTAPNPQSLYGLHKLEAEKRILDKENTLVYRFATAFGVSPCMRVDLLINNLVYQACTDGNLVIFQADFRRTFIHVIDMCYSFLWGLAKFDALPDRLYNVGFPANNWTKREVAEKIKEKTGCLVTYSEIDEDTDQRNYDVDYSRIMSAGYTAKISIEEGIDELLRIAPLLSLRVPYE